jgi:uncharacterized membrane protein
MNTLLLVGILIIIGSFFAVPLFEFVFGALLVAPVLKLLLARTLMITGVSLGSGIIDAALYIAGFLAVIGMTAYTFGRRKKEFKTEDLLPFVVFFAVFITAYNLCLLWPDFIAMGERLRDYALLSSSIDSPVIPKEPWMEGSTLNYYVFWYRFGAMMHSLLGIATWDAYHAILSFSLAFYAAAIFQIVRVVFGGSVLLSAFTAVALAFGSNIAGVFSWMRAEGGGFVADVGWWGPSRVIRGAIDEFPAWSFLLGDAHPHFLNLGTLPFCILILYRIVSSSAPVVSRAIYSVTFVAAATLFLVGSNAWEVPMWAGTSIMIGLVAWIVFQTQWYAELFTRVRAGTKFDAIRAASCLLVLVFGLFVAYKVYEPENKLPSIFAALVAIGFSGFLFPYKAGLVGKLSSGVLQKIDVVSVSFWIILFAALRLSSSHISSGEGGKLEFVRDPVTVTTVAELWTHWGFHLFFISAATILLFDIGLPTLFMTAFLAVTLLYEKAALFVYVLIGFQLLRLLTQREQEQTWRDIFIEALAVCSLGLVLLPEIAFLNDSYGGDNERMNTIFKVYTTDWALLGLTAVALSLRVYNRYKEALKDSGISGLPAFVAFVLGFVVLGASTKLYAFTIPKRMMQKQSEQGWSEGLASPDRDHPGSKTIIRVLRDKPKGRVLEGQGNPYSYTSFISTLSGQPSYLGWSNHVGLLTKNHAETGRRTEVTKQIYTGDDCAARKELAKRENIKYIVLGTLERKYHPGAFDKDFSCLTMIVHDRDYWLFEVD